MSTISTLYHHTVLLTTRHSEILEMDANLLSLAHTDKFLFTFYVVNFTAGMIFTRHIM